MHSELLEIYKLHAELADRVSQRRGDANRIYVSLITGIFVFLGIMLRFRTADIPINLILMGASVFGFLMSLSWIMLIESYRQLNSVKFKALDKLENELAFPFFRKEWKYAKEGRDWRVYRRLTFVERFPPCTFALLFAGLFGYSLYSIL